MDINAFLNEYQLYIGPLLVIIMMLESAPVIGFFIPGSFILPVVGAMVGNGDTSFWYLFGYAATGAFIGDVTGYWLGREGSSKWLPEVLDNKHQQIILQAHAQVNKHGALAIFLGRFIWLIHPAIPGAAGFLNIRPRTFLLIDPLAVTIWVFVYMGAGYLLTGYWAQRTLELFEIVSIVILLLTILWSLRAIAHYLLSSHKDR